MKNLFKRLSTFAGDYSGACLAARKMKCLIVLHGQGGCSGGVCTCDDIEQDSGDMRMVFTKISEVDTVIGNDEIMIDRIESAVQYVPCDFILLCGSPIPMLIGTDFESWVKRLENDAGKPVVALTTKGFARYDEGEQLLFDALIDKFGVPANIRKNRVNVIGDTALNGWTAVMREEYRESLKSRFDDVVFWGMDADINSLKTVGEAEMNIAVSSSAVKAVKKLRSLFGTPYEIASPFKNVERKKCAGRAETVLIVGEQMMAKGMRDCLRNGMGFSDITAASFFGADDEIAEKNDIRLYGEDDYVNLLEGRGPYDYIIGDIELEVFGGYKKKFIEYPHIAVSGRLISESLPDVFGEKGYEFLKERMEKYK